MRHSPASRRRESAGMTRPCAACKEPTDFPERVGAHWFCAACVIRLRNAVAAKRRREAPASAAIRDALRNSDRHTRRGDER